MIRAGFGIYSGAAQNDDLNAGLESDTFRASVAPASGVLPLDPVFQQEFPDLSGFTGANGLSKAANHPRALQRQGRLDQYVETWGLTVEHELPARVLLHDVLSGKPRRALVFAGRRKPLQDSSGDQSEQ